MLLLRCQLERTPIYGEGGKEIGRLVSLLNQSFIVKDKLVDDELYRDLDGRRFCD